MTLTLGFGYPIAPGAIGVVLPIAVGTTLCSTTHCSYTHYSVYYHGNYGNAWLLHNQLLFNGDAMCFDTRSNLWECIPVIWRDVSVWKSANQKPKTEEGACCTAVHRPLFLDRRIPLWPRRVRNGSERTFREAHCQGLHRGW